MKNVVIIFIFLVSSITSYSQVDLDYGTKGGINYGSHGDLTIFSGFSPDINNAIGEVGFNIGIYTQFNFKNFYIRPEFLYTNTKSSYNSELDSDKYRLSSLDLPILFGYKITEH